jgi:hypothetical protein
MNQKKKTLLLSIYESLMLSACGSGGSSSTNPEPTPTPTPENNATSVYTLPANQIIVPGATIINPVNNQVVYPTVSYATGSAVSTSEAITYSSSSWTTMSYNSGSYSLYTNSSGNCSLNYLGNIVCGNNSGSVIEINPNNGAVVNTYDITSSVLSISGGYMSDATNYYTLNYQYCNLSTKTCSFLTGRNDKYSLTTNLFTVNGSYLYTVVNNYPNAAPVIGQINMQNNSITYLNLPSNVGLMLNSAVVFKDSTHFYLSGLKTIYQCTLNGTISCDNGTNINGADMSTMDGDTLAYINGNLYVDGTQRVGSSVIYKIYQINL